jgi:hypothetical protein
MSKENMTDKEFKNSSIQKVEKSIKDEKYPCEISRVSKITTLGCEWCENRSRVVFIGVSATGTKDFTRGHCNNGQYSIFEDSNFRPQSEWFVCGKCEES